MPGVTAIDHALPNGKGGVDANGDGTNADPGGMTNDEKQAVGGLLQRDEGKGAAVHAFDPDATPEQKAAAAGKARAALAPASEGAEKLKSRMKGRGNDEGGRAVTVDTSSSKKAPTPTVTLSQIDQVSRGEGQGLTSASIPGGIPTGAAPPVPTWLLTGWRQVANKDLIMAGGDQKLAEQQSILAEYVSEQAYGSWFHNAGIILFAVLSTRFITTIRLGWGWVILILVACASYYTLSIRRTRERARDDMQRELTKTRLVTETESADWMNSFLERFWLIYEPILSQTIVASVDNALAASTPGFLESIRMTTFTLGTKAPRIDYIRTFPKTPEDVVIMDWALSFTPSDVMDITKRQAMAQVNPKIVLSIRVGKGVVSKALPILLEDINFTGKMRIKLQLMTNFPHVKTVEISFIEKPTFDYVLKPIGGETLGFDINNIPGLAPFIRDQVHANLGPMMYDPNVFTIDLQALLSGNPLDSAIGVLKLYVRGARSLKATKIGGGAPDPYVTIALGSKPSIAKTKTITNSSNPSFQETHFILINSLADILAFAVYDYNDHRPDNLLGTVTQELAGLADDAEQESIVSRVISGGKDRGELRYDMSYFPVLQPTKNPDGTIEAPPDSQTGIVRFFIHQAKDLDIARQHGDLSPFVKVFLGGSKTEVHRTQIMKHSPQPIWESHTEFLVPEKKNSVITLQIINTKDFAPDPKLGNLSVKLSDLLEAGERQQDWFPLQNSRAGKIRLSAVWKPVAMTGALDGAATYTPPIGILRVHLKKAVDVKNVEAALGGKSDPYVRVMGANRTLARTEVIQNSLNPEWDQIVYVPVHHLKISYIFELMDYQNIGKDRSLGIVDLKLSDYIEESGDPAYPYKSKGARQVVEKIRLDKANHFKGTLHFDIDFKPAMSLRGGVSFEAKKNELEIAAEEKADKESDTSVSSSDEEKIGYKVNHERKQGKTPATHARRVSEQISLVTPNPPRAPGHGASASVDRASLTPSANGTVDTTTDIDNPEKGVVMSHEDLISHQAGILVFQVISGQLARRGSLEVMFDDGYWPSFTSNKARSTHAAWDQVGEGFVRELDFSRIWLRINANDSSNDKDDIVAEFKCDTKDFLEQCYNEPADFVLAQADGSNKSTIRMTARYVPVNIVLEPRESINNMGVLRVEVVGAKNLMAGDRSGKSDPYVTFNLGGTRVFKSETKKKTLSPVWNESFEAMIPSRVAAKFDFEVQDWNTVGTSTALGGGRIDLASLEPFELQEMSIPVVHPEKGTKGQLDLRLLFQPEIIARSRNKTSTFSTAGRVITTVGAVPMGVGKGALKGGAYVAGGVLHGGGAVVGGVGHGIGTVGGFAGRKIGLIKKKDKSGKEVLVPADADPDDINAGQISVPAGSGDGAMPGSGATTLPVGEGEVPSETGTLAITVLGAKDLSSKEGSGVKPYVSIKVGGKTHKTGHSKGIEPEWDETLSFTVGPETSTFSATVLEKHNFGKDIELGEAEIAIWRHIQPAIPTADVWVELTNGTGQLRLRLDWSLGSGHGKHGSGGGIHRNKTASIRGGSEAPESPSRFSLKRSKTKDRE